MSSADRQTIERIDEALRSWRQGDFVLAEDVPEGLWFLFRIEPSAPLSPPAVEAAEQGLDAAEASVRGFMLATQTCDAVRSCEKRSFVELCPLVAVSQEDLRQIRKGRRPRYAHVPGAERWRLVADLDRVMCVEKAVLAGWKRREGCRSDAEARSLARALARKRARVAFPDDFTRWVGRLRDRLLEKHGKRSPEGEALRSLQEIRVQASPSWEAPEVGVFFWFIREEDGEQNLRGMDWPALKRSGSTSSPRRAASSRSTGCSSTWRT